MLILLDSWKNQFGKVKFDKLSISNWTFTACVACKNQFRNQIDFLILNLIFRYWKKIEWHFIFQKSSGDRQGVDLTSCGIIIFFSYSQNCHKHTCMLTVKRHVFTLKILFYTKDVNNQNFFDFLLLKNNVWWFFISQWICIWLLLPKTHYRSLSNQSLRNMRKLFFTSD